jgi:mRNA interferase RelE/StbE
MKVVLHHTAEKYLGRLSAVDRNRIGDAIDGLEKDPLEGDIRPYEGNPGILRLRVGNFRVIFRFEKNNTILVSHIEPRGQAYTKKTKAKRGKK